MAKITTKTPGYTGLVAGVRFVDGAGETEDENALAYFARHGYTVEAPDAPPYPEGTPADTWKVDQLKRWATERSIDLAGATKKDEILAAIVTAQTPPAPPAPSQA